MLASLIGSVVVLGIIVAVVGLYLLPVILAWTRHAPDFGAVAAINVFLGWTLVGWVVALALSLRSAAQPAPAVQVFQQLPPVPGSPPLGADWASQHDPGPPVPPDQRE